MVWIELSGDCGNRVRFFEADSGFSEPDPCFKGEYLSCFPLRRDSGLELCVGLGRKAEITQRRLTDAAAKAVKVLRGYCIHEAVFDFSRSGIKLDETTVRCAVMGIKLGLYQYRKYRSDFREENFRFFLSDPETPLPAAAETSLKETENVCDGILEARDLVNMPANGLPPAVMAELLRGEAEKVGVQAEILDERQAEALGMGAFLAVGNSSGNPPRLIVLRYLADDESSSKIALVGKGVTCDTGGYCLKGRDSMLGIKGDMAGGAAVAQAIFALAKNGIRANVVGIIPACENRISRQSFVPGDIIRSMSGKTIEIRNTDAEGRLILADAVTYAVRVEKVSRIVDIATLTGAVVSALGFTTAGVLTNDENLWRQLQEAGELSQEQYSRLPIYPEYEKLLHSDLADIRNMGESYCGTITAGLFIQAFCEGLPWLHIDIAGTAWVDKPFFEYQSCGATGASVATLYQLIRMQQHT